MNIANGMMLMTLTNNVFHFRSCVHILRFTDWQIRLEIRMFYNGHVVFVILLYTLGVFKPLPKL